MAATPAQSSAAAGTAERELCEWDSLPNERLNFWTIGNVSEVLPGIIPPLTATLYRPMDFLGTGQVADMIASRDLVTPQEPPIANFIGVFAGRAALNLAWANGIIGAWQTGEGSDLMAQFVTSTDGHDISAGAATDQERGARTFALVLKVWAQAERSIGTDTKRIEALRAKERARDFAAMSERQLWRHVQRLSRKTIAYARHLLISGAAGEHTQWLGKFLQRVLPDQPETMVIMLTSALRNVESARPSMGAWDLAQWIKRHKALAQEVERLSPNAIAAKLANPQTKDWKAFAAEFAAFIREFGFRGQCEADPSAADWEEEPAFALSAIKTYLRAGAEKNPYKLEEAAAQRREAIETSLFAALPRGERKEFRRLLRTGQKFARLREGSKANWVRTMRPMRRPVVELGTRLAARGIIDQPADIWYLLDSEVEQAVGRTLDAAEAKAAVARRKETRKRLALYTLPEVFTTPVDVTLIPQSEAMTGGVLLGMPVSAGKASGRARVVLSADAAEEVDLEPGEVLVAPYTDAPWTPLFVPAAAVVVETGGILSHAATVAREFGIPAVVAVKGATRLIKTGQQVTVDGNTGQVTVGA